MKKVFAVVGVVVLIVGALILYLVGNLDQIAKRAIERIGSETLGVEVTAEEVSIELSERRGSIGGIVVDNPPGFSGEPAIRFGELKLDIERGTGTINLIRVADTTIRLESVEGVSNFDRLLGGIPEEAPPPDESTVEDEDGVPVVLDVRRVEIEAVSASVISDARDEPIEMTVDGIAFTDLKGTSEEVMSQMMRQLLRHVIEQTKSAVRQSVGEAIEQKVEDAKESLRESLESRLEERREEN